MTDRSDHDHRRPTSCVDRLDDPSLTLVDVRPLAAYNGWRLGDEARGGHIPGAAAFPVEWLRTVDEPEIARLLAGKGVTPDRDVVVYGDGADDAAAARRSSSSASAIPGARVFDGGLRRMGGRPVAARREAAEVREARPHRLASPGPGGRAARGGTDRRLPALPRQLRRPRGVRRGAHPGRPLPRHEHARGPGRLEPALARGRSTPRSARWASPRTRRSSSTAATPRARRTRSGPVGAPGQIAATRALMILTYAGVEDVRLLDGGYDWWVRDGNPVETILREPSPVADFGAVIPVRPEVIVDIDEAKEIIADPDGAALVSVRTWREHIGAVSGYNYIGPAGRIKGDVWGNCGTDAYHMQHYRNVDNTMRAYPEITRQLGRGRDRPREVGRVLLRHRLACERDVVLRVPPGLAAHRGLRRWLVRVEPGSGEQPDRDRRAGRRDAAGRVRRLKHARVEPHGETVDGWPKPLRIGLVGCGDVARRHYLPALADLADRVRVVSCMDVRLRSGRRPGRRHRRLVAGCARIRRPRRDARCRWSGCGHRPGARDAARNGEPGGPRRRCRALLGEADRGTLAEADGLIETARERRCAVPVRSRRGRHEAVRVADRSRSLRAIRASDARRGPSRRSGSGGLARVHR